MYDFLRRPAWIVSHLVVASLIVLAVVLGFWQRSRYLEETDRQDRIDALAASDPVPYDDVVEPGTSPDEVDPEIEFTRVQVTGEYDTSAEVAILNRSLGGAPGAWVLTPLVQADGTAVPVVRGWITYDPAGSQEDFPEAAPPEGEVTVTGIVQLTQERGSLGAVDAAEGTLQSMARIDLARFAQQLDRPLGGAWVMLDEQSPPQPDGIPATVEVAAADSSQNFGYMVQWWIFATIALIGYPLVLRRVARHRSEGAPPGRTPLPDDAATTEPAGSTPGP
jgi:cytochrome oxidase assembly protein ShyY1